jgi:MoaA/NifB/PqqE/SkfB family radical SAM enzyme
MSAASGLGYADQLRISIHGLGELHDNIVRRPGAFRELEEAICFAQTVGVRLAAVTVVSPLNIQEVKHVAAWCLDRGFKHYFLFGLMKSGRGQQFVADVGEVAPERFDDLLKAVQGAYMTNGFEVSAYTYRAAAECILVYGDGSVIIDPSFDSATYQKMIGNILRDEPKAIMDEFIRDDKNLQGYRDHLRRTLFFDDSSALL